MVVGLGWLSGGGADYYNLLILFVECLISENLLGKSFCLGSM